MSLVGRRQPCVFVLADVIASHLCFSRKGRLQPISLPSANDSESKLAGGELSTKANRLLAPAFQPASPTLLRGSLMGSSTSLSISGKQKPFALTPFGQKGFNWANQGSPIDSASSVPPKYDPCEDYVGKRAGEWELWERPEVFDLKRRTLRTAQLAVSAASNLTHFVGQSLDPGIEPTAIPAAVEQERLSKVNAMVDKMLEELADGDSEHDPDTAQGGGEELQAPAILTVDDWQTFWVDVDGDKGWGGYYFVNSQSGQTTWDCPDPRLLQFTDALNRTRVAALMCFNPYHVTIPHPVAVQGRWAVFADPDTATPYFVRLSEGQALAWKKVILGDIPPSEVLAAVPTVQTEQCPSAAESPSGGGDFPAGHSQWDQPADWDSDAAACPPLTLLGDWLVYREPAVLMQYFVHRQTQESAWVPPPAVASSVVGAAGATVYSAPCVAQVGQWQLMCDDTTGGWYYYNEADGCSQWEPPAEVVEADMDAWQIVDPNAAARFFEGGGEADGSHQNEEGGNEETGNAVEGEGVGSDGPAPPGLITEPMHAPFAAPQATPTPAATKTPEAAGSASSTQRIVVHRPRASCAGLLPALPKRRSRLSMAAGPDATAAATAANAAGQANGVSSTTTTPRGVEGIGPLAPTLRSIMPLRPATPTSPVSQSTAGGSEGGLSIDGLNTPRSDGGSGPVAVARPANSPVSPAWAEHADPERMFDSRRDLMGSFGAAALKPTSNVTNTAGSSAALHSGRGNPASGRSTGTGTGPTGSGSSTPQRQSPRGMAAKPDHDGALSDSEDVQTGRDKSGGTGHSADAKEPFRLPWGLGGGVAVYSAQSKRPAAPSKPATMTIRPSEAAAPNGEAGGTAAAPVANAQAGAAGFDDFIRKRLTAVHEKQLAEAMARRNKAGGGRPAAALKQVATSELLEDMGGQGTDYMVEVPGENVEEALLDAVAGLAGACGLAPPDLLRVLQKGGGVDPVKWAATYRLKLAQQLNDMEQQTGGIPAAKEREMRRKRDIATRMLSWESEERAKRRSQREVLKRQQLKQQEAEMEALRMRRNKDRVRAQRRRVETAQAMEEAKRRDVERAKAHLQRDKLEAEAERMQRLEQRKERRRQQREERERKKQERELLMQDKVEAARRSKREERTMRQQAAKGAQRAATHLGGAGEASSLPALSDGRATKSSSVLPPLR